MEGQGSERRDHRKARRLILRTVRGGGIKTDLKSRKRTYLIMMGVCLLLYLLSWTLLARFSPTAAIAVSIAAMAIPPFAVIIANRDGDHG